MAAMTDAEVAIVGAGPVGSALAIMLGRAGRRTILLDRARFPRDKACGEGLLPAGARVLEQLGIGLEALPALAGVTYRVPTAGSVQGRFVGRVGRGARRLAFDEQLANAAALTPNVEAAFGCKAIGVEQTPDGVSVETEGGAIRARFLVGADGYRSQVAGWLGWRRPPQAPHRYALVGHFDAPGHGFDRIVVTLLDGCEVYLAPTGPAELLVALLGSKAGLRRESEAVGEAYTRRAAEAHPELAGCGHTAVQGAGPFWTRPSTIAEGRVFLVGDAAGFLDPLTGDGITAGLLAADRLSTLLGEDQPRAAEAYKACEGRRWRRRVFMGRLALTLCGSSGLARRAIRGLAKHPAALDRLLEVNEGTRSPFSLAARDWVALAGV
jgi:flavin-dependent dehydrogenase